jgi:hypothetical protein
MKATDLLTDIDEILTREGRGHVRFALVIWSEYGDEPQFVGSNDASTARVLDMLATAREFVKKMEPVGSGGGAVGNA